MIKIEKRVCEGLEGYYEDALQRQKELEQEKNNDKIAICEEMKNVDVKEVLEAFAEAIERLNARYEKKAKIQEIIIAECTENVEVEYPDEEEVDLDEENTETVE